MKMDSGSSQPWWSHNRPKHSKWLQENVGDVEANVQTMLALIEGDADSFAQRAEMYYKKRPELLKVVEQFYRGYRALTERYDQLTGSIRQIPAALQVQYGLVPESPRSSPFGKQMTFKKQGSGLDKFKDSPNNSYAESNNESADLSGCEGEGESFEISSMDDKSVAQTQEGDESSSTCSDMDSENSNLEIQKLQQTIAGLQAENKKLTDKSREKLQQFRDTEKRLHGFREDFLKVQKENNTVKAEITAGEKLRKKLEDEVRELHLEKESLEREIGSGLAVINELEVRVSSLKEENEKQSESAAMKVTDLQTEIGLSREENKQLLNRVLAGEEKEKELVAALRFMKGAASSLGKRNKALLEQISSLLKDQEAKEDALEEKTTAISSLVDEMQKLESAAQENQQTVANLNGKITDLNSQLSVMQEENEKQLLAISECAEEKREVIRQLCFSLDLMNNKNQRLEEVLVLAKSKLTVYQKLASTQGSGWRSIFAP